MSFKDEVNEQIRKETLKMLKEGDPVPDTVNGDVAQRVLLEVLSDSTVLAEVADDSGESKDTITAVLNSLKKSVE